MIVWLPEALGVNVTEQVAVVPDPDSVQGLPVNEPVPPENVTDPVGVALPLVAVTVAVQVVPVPTTVDEGTHDTPVGVGGAAAVIVSAVLP